MKKRNSNIEILRIFSMLMIVAGHFIEQSGLTINETSINNFLLVLIGSGSRIAVNIFLLIGIWFMIDSDFKSFKVFKLYGQVIFYCWPLTILSLVFFESGISIKDVARGILPFWGRALWFVSAYITLLFFSPFINTILKWEKRRLRLLVVLVLFFVSVVSTLPDLQDAYLCDSMWFVVVYLIIGYQKKYPIKVQYINIFNLILGCGLYICLVTASYLGKTNNGVSLFRIIGKFGNQYISDIKTIPNFVIALLIFFYVINLQNYHNKVINYLAGNMFSIYIFHQIPAFYPILWKYVFRSDLWVGSPIFIYPIAVFVGICIFVTLTEVVRKKIFEPKWLNNKFICLIQRKIDALYAL